MPLALGAEGARVSGAPLDRGWGAGTGGSGFAYAKNDANRAYPLCVHAKRAGQTKPYKNAHGPFTSLALGDTQQGALTCKCASADIFTPTSAPQ